MNSIFIPKTIKVGYQNRTNTYTGKLAYVIYTDEKGKLRKERSWNSWRDSKIEPSDFDNKPTEGFVLNKKAGGYSTRWNHRQAYSRVYDPRGFEFEITIENLLYILENANCIKGKGLEGEFVYGWEGKNLILIPVQSPDYKEIVNINKIIHSKEHVKPKELILGATYKTRQNEEWIYMGKFDRYSYSGKKTGKQFCFLEKEDSRIQDYYSFQWIKNIGQKLVFCISEDPVSNYAFLMDKLESTTEYSPIDKKKTKYLPLTLEDFTKLLKKDHYVNTCFTREKENIYRLNICKNLNNEFNLIVYDNDDGIYYGYKRRKTEIFQTIEEIFNKYKLFYKEIYLMNGKLYQTEGKPE